MKVGKSGSQETKIDQNGNGRHKICFGRFYYLHVRKSRDFIWSNLQRQKGFPTLQVAPPGMSWEKLVKKFN